MPYHKMPRVTGWENDENFDPESLSEDDAFPSMLPPPGYQDSLAAGFALPPIQPSFTPTYKFGDDTDHTSKQPPQDLTGPMLGFMAANQIGSLLGNIFRRSPAPAAWSAPTLPAPAPTYANVKLLDRRHS